MFFTALSNKELQIKLQWDIISHPLVCLLCFKKKEARKKRVASAGKNVKKLEPWCPAGGNVKHTVNHGK